MGVAHLAKTASQRSGEYVTAGDKEGWLSLFSEDAVLEDPVGESPLDPSGQGHRGKAAIEAFWDTVIAPGSIDFQVVSSHPAGDECANVVHMVNTMPGDMRVVVDMVVVYRADAEGKLVSLRAFWDYESVMAQLG